MINEKIQQAISILNEKEVDLWLCFVRETSSTPDPSLELILGTHVTWPSAFILTATGEKVAIVGSLDAQNVKDHAEYDIIGYVDSVKEPLLDVLRKHDPKRIAINYSLNDVTSDGLTHGMYMMLTDYLKDTPYLDRLESSEPIIAALRGRKSPAEIEAIQGAIQETLFIFDEVSAYVKTGFAEKNVALFINSRLNERQLEPAWDPEHCPAVFTGPDSAGAHAGPTNRSIEPGHIMNIDFGVRKNGYVSDLQRTWYFLRPGEMEAPEAVQKGFNTIRDAIQEAAKILKQGVEGWEVDTAARGYILQAGYESFPHALGHQVGRKAHDGSALLCPKWERYGQLPYSVVEEGMVFTLEPRLTVPGHGIATIEEIVVVKKDGAEFLSKPQMELYLVKS